MTKFAVFDIDGTLYRWQLYHELVHRLATDGVFPDKDALAFNAAWENWHSGTISFDDYEHVVLKTMHDNLPSIPIKKFDTACEEVARDSSHLHKYPKQLLLTLKNQNYVIIAITGSQQELIDRFAKHNGIDIAIGVQYERKNGHFTGKTTRSVFGRKPEILKDLVKQHNLDWKDSVAIGDSDGDASLLELVEHPIAFNPSAGLLERAKNSGWSIIIERKNIAYNLEVASDKIHLKDTFVY